MANMTTGTNANLLQDVFLAKRFVEALRRDLVVAKLGRREDAPRHSGKKARWQFFANPVAATTALSEGQDPTSPTSLATSIAEATISEYGAYFEPAQLFLSTAAMGTKAELVDAAAYQAALTIDTLCYSQSLNDATNTGTSAGMTAELVRADVATLYGLDAKPHPSTPGGAFFAGVMHPEALFDMMGEGTDFGTTSAQAPTWERAKMTSGGMPGAIGIPGSGNQNATIYGVYITTTTNVSASASSRHDNYIIGKDAFGVTSIDGDYLSPRVIITDPEQRVDKPLRNSGTIGWHVSFASEMIDANRFTEQQTTDT